MPVRLSDAQIQELLGEPKRLDASLMASMNLRPKRGHREWDLDVSGSAGSNFRVIVRQSAHNPLDFSAVMIFGPPGSNQVFRLRRYNGLHSQHTNRIEGDSFYDFHIHMATERYQDLGLREDTYAEPTNRFSDLAGAIACLEQDCAFEITGPSQGRLV